MFVDRVFGRRVATGALNNLLWFGYLVTLALYAVAFADYASALVIGDHGSSAWVHHLLVGAAIVVPTILNLARAGLDARTETAIVGLKMAILVLVVTAGAASAQGDRLSASTWRSP